MPTAEASSRKNSSTSNSVHYSPPDPGQVDVLIDAMSKMQMRALDMLKNHAKILANEASIMEKVKEYEQDVDRVSKAPLGSEHGNKVEKTLRRTIIFN